METFSETLLKHYVQDFGGRFVTVLITEILQTISLTCKASPRVIALKKTGVTE